MSIPDGVLETKRTLANEQEKPLGLFAGLFLGISAAFEEHKQNLQERVMAKRERIILAAEENQELAAETTKPFLLGLLDAWLFNNEKVVEAKPVVQDYSRELLHIGADKTSSIAIEPVAEKGDSLLANLGNLPVQSTPSVARSQSQNIGHAHFIAA